MVKNSSLAGYALCFVAGFGLGFVYHHIASYATSNEPVDAARMRSFEIRLAQLEARQAAPYAATSLSEHQRRHHGSAARISASCGT